MNYQLRFSGKHHQILKHHLLPGDGKEAVAVLLCGRHEAAGLSILISHELELIPHAECERESDFIRWKTDRIVKLLDKAAKYNMAILKIHSHPGGYSEFSKIDDRSDEELFRSVFSWCETESVHGSAVMLPTGEVFGRVFTSDLKDHKISKISIAGDNIMIWENDRHFAKDDFSVRTVQAFGEATYAKLQRLKAVVVGCSGTGSPTIEQLARLGIKDIVLIDPDVVEKKNLNRILNTFNQDALDGRFKVDVFKDAIAKMGFGTKVKVYSKNLFDSKEALLDIVTGDVLFGCVDSVDGRHLLSQLSNFYNIPYFDLGVGLKADGNGGISSIVGSIHYLQPGLSSLMSRGLYNAERLRSESMRRQSPQEYEEQVKQKYIEGVNEERPAVISINMAISAIAVTEFLNRLHPFKDEESSCYAKVVFDFCGGCLENVPEELFLVDEFASKWAGRGDHDPFLRMTGL